VFYLKIIYTQNLADSVVLCKAAPQRETSHRTCPGPSGRVRPGNRLNDVWVPDEAARKRVLVDNPAELYGFPKA